jgi:hypothetical protein
VKVSLILVDLELLSDEVKCSAVPIMEISSPTWEVISSHFESVMMQRPVMGSLLTEIVFSFHLIVGISRYVSTYIGHFMWTIEVGIQYRAILALLREYYWLY